jgi:hypothetical protein
MRPVDLSEGATASSKINGTCIQNRCGHDGQRKRVAHMHPATTTTEDSRSKLAQLSQLAPFYDDFRGV